jgi:hypothetical protein
MSAFRIKRVPQQVERPMPLDNDIANPVWAGLDSLFTLLYKLRRLIKSWLRSSIYSSEM